MWVILIVLLLPVIGIGISIGATHVLFLAYHQPAPEPLTLHHPDGTHALTTRRGGRRCRVVGNCAALPPRSLVRPAGVDT